MSPVLLLVLAAAVVAGVAATLAYRKAARRKARAMEERIRNAERLAFLGTLAGGLAHEIRNPLSTLNINLQLLKEDWQNPVTSKEQRAARKIEALLRESRRLEEILNDFLRFAGRHPLHLVPVSPNAVIDELLDLIGPEARQKKIEVRKELDPAVPAVPLDANLLKQALVNILRNAQEAMPKGGALTVQTHRNREHVHLSVADTGPGVPPEIRDKIFEAYFTTKTSGSGLGLPTAKRIVEEHNGAIAVEDAAGGGARFTIRLPLA
jgi:signal transduction histidine kinase